MENKKELTFEQKLEKLETIVKELESGDVLLDDAINKFNEAMELSKECNEILEKANKTINKVLNKNDEFESFEIDND
jgi:exodeoxyribonuclease VII, small subunit